MKTLKVKSILFSLLAMMAVAVFMTSCEQDAPMVGESDSLENLKTAYIEKYKKLYNGRGELAKILSYTITSEDSKLLSVFEELCLSTQKNGHYEQEFFFNLEKDTPRDILNGQSIADYLSAKDPKAAELLDNLCINDPGLTILLVDSGTSKLFDTKIYYDDGFEDMDPNAEVPYYENGNISKVLVQKALTKKSFIVRECETYLSPEELQSDKYTKSLNGSKSMGKVCGNDIICYIPLTEVSINEEEWNTQNNSLDIKNGMCDRDMQNGKENLQKFRARNDYDIGGTGEFLFYVIFAEDVEYSNSGGGVTITGGTFDYVTKRVAGVSDNNQWMTVDLEVICWNEEEDGSRMKHVLYEDDGGFSTTVDIRFEVGGFSTSVPIEISKGDDLIGESIIDYCDNLGFEYHPSGDVDFVLSERGTCTESSGGSTPGTPCNDGNPNTYSDTYNSDGECIGICIFTPGTSCNDGNPNTINDTYNSNCECIGIFVIGCEPGTPCDDGNPKTLHSVYNEDCECVAIFGPEEPGPIGGPY